jgi:cytochrome b subunit of formate dehydrogenase
VARVDCGVCHDEAAAQYAASVHGRAREVIPDTPPGCAACHGKAHGLVPVSDPSSPVHAARLATTCGRCHAEPQLAEKLGIPHVRPIESYLGSVHARVVADRGTGPTCSGCHGSHAILDAADPRSTVHHQRVPDTCGSCHAEIAAAFAASVHGRAAAHGVREAPVCTDCHGEHRILSPSEPGSPVYATNIPALTCGRCHGDLRVAEKFGLSITQVSSYRDSYHGLAARSGVVTVAHCGSCHGVHDILPSSDPASHVHPSNLPQTCGRCHPGAGSRFAIGPVHVVETERQHAAVYWIRLFYLWTIFLTIGGMVLHNSLDLIAKARRPPRPAPGPPRGEERMSAGFRIAHGLLVASFVLLAYSGFARKYPEAWWARPVLLWEDRFGLRGWLHRAASVVMLGALAFHLLHLAISRRARACIARMRPRLEDVRELRDRMAWYLGRREQAPHTAELGYPEKAEYLALMWGIGVMACTGMLLWFEGPVLRWLPKWVTDVSTVIHFYEAVLATLAIVVWHFYFVIFDPAVYPMDPAWITGRSAPGRQQERTAAGGGARPTAAGGRRRKKRAR